MKTRQLFSTPNQFLGLILLIFVAWLSPWSILCKAGQINLAAIRTVSELINLTEPENISIHDDQARSNCRLWWFQGMEAQYKSQIVQRDQAWLTALDCSDRYVPLLRQVAPENLELAQYAIEIHPESADGWFWLASLATEENPEQAIGYFQTGLGFEPKNGGSWLKLGYLLEARDPPAAIKAFLNACQYGDPGRHGCQFAGLVAEQMGDHCSAIHYYHLSRYPPVYAKGDELREQHPELVCPIDTVWRP